MVKLPVTVDLTGEEIPIRRPELDVTVPVKLDVIRSARGEPELAAKTSGLGSLPQLAS